jgi:hypothetical protein
MKVLQIIALLFILSVSSFAQNKIAVIDAKTMYDKEFGIKKLVESQDFLSNLGIFETNCDIRCPNLEKEREKLQEEIKRLSKSRKPTDEKSLKLYKLGREIFELKTERARIHLRVRNAVFFPIWQKILQNLGKFLSLNGYKSVFQKVDGKIVQTLDFANQFDSKIAVDITTDFIKFCNEEFEKEKTQK